MKTSESEVTCPSASVRFYELQAKKDYYERFYYLTIWLLPAYMDVL